MKRAVLTIYCFLASFAVISAGDLSTFQSLGFSDDGSHYSFGFFGIQNSGFPYANFAIVETAKNSFVKESDKELSGKEMASLNQDGSTSLLKLLIQNKELITKYKINPEKTGRPIYVLLNKEDAKDNLVFTDFTTKNLYNVNLIQKKSSLGASFSIQFSISDSSSKIKTYTLGRPLFIRPNITNYTIRQIILSPDESQLVFVIEKALNENSNFSNAWMVETISIK